MLKNFSHAKVALLLWRFFLLRILLKNLDVVVLEELSLLRGISKTFLVDLKITSELLECFAFVWFCIFCLVNIFEKVWENFSHSSSVLTLAQIFAPFDCLHSSWCKLSWKCSVIGLNSGFKFSGKFLSLYFGPFSDKVQILEKDGTCYF